MRALLLALTLVFAVAAPLDGAKILLITPMVPGMYSHVTQMAHIGEALQQRGHNISWLVPNTGFLWPRVVEIPFTKIWYAVNETDYEQGDKVSSMLFKLEYENPASVSGPIALLTDIIGRFYTTLLNDTWMLREVENSKFDMVVIDNFFLHRNFYLIPARLGLPYISLVDIMDPWMARAPWLPSHVPHGLLDYTEHMSFLQRLTNAAFNIIWTLFPSQLYEIPIDPAVKKRYTDDIPNYSSISDLVARSKLWLITTSEHVDYVKPMMANMINIGGHSTKPGAPLTGELAEFVESAKEGVIVVSFGSGIKALPREVIDKLMFIFGQLPQKVVWRLSDKSLTKVPRNVMLLDWLPQNDILGHPNVKLFINHCGRNGQYETLYNAVPTISMPVQGEQSYNAKRFVEKGFGVELDLRTFTAEDLLAAITEVLENPVYARNIARASEMFKNQLHHPLDVATHWIEHVIKYGDEHLRTQALDMPWYQYLMLDITAACVVIVYVVVRFVLGILRCTCRLCCRRKSEKVKTQ